MGNKNLGIVFVVWFSLFCTPFIFIIGLIAGVFVDYSNSIGPILNWATTIGAIFSGIGATGTFIAAYSAHRIWKNRIIHQSQHDAIVEMRINLTKWIYSFEMVFNRISNLRTTNFPEYKREYFEELRKNNEKEEHQAWAKASDSSLRLACLNYNDKMESGNELEKIRWTFMVCVERFIEEVNGEHKAINKASANVFQQIDLSKENGHYKWIKENIYPHYEKLQSMKSELER